MNYGELKAAVAAFLNRQDLDAVIPTFITLCEADLNRSVRHRSMLARATATLDTHFTTLPEDFLEGRNIQLNTTPVTSLKFVTMEHADLLRQQQSSGKPKYYTIVGDTIEVVPEPDAEYEIELTYYQTIPSMDVDDETNWLLTLFPDVYLYGTLMQSAPYLKDDERVGVWGSLYRQYISDVNSMSTAAEYSGANLVMRAVF